MNIKDRIPLGNKKNNILALNIPSNVTTVAQLIAHLSSGCFADVMVNNDTGENIGVASVEGVPQLGVPANKAFLQQFVAASGITTGTSDTLALEQDGFALFDGATVRFKLHVDMNKGATLNVSDTGDIPIVDTLGKEQKARAGSYCTVIYSSTNENFILQGSGGGAGLSDDYMGYLGLNALYSMLKNGVS